MGKKRKQHASNLGVAEDAGTRTIRRAFRREALLRHPDKRGSTPEAHVDFQSLLESYEYLLAHPYRPPPAERSRPVAAPPPETLASAAPAPGGNRGVLWIAGALGVGFAVVAAFLAAPHPSPTLQNPERVPAGLEVPEPEAPVAPALTLPAAQLGTEECRASLDATGDPKREPPAPRAATRSVCEVLCDNWLAGFQPDGGLCYFGNQLVAQRKSNREAPTVSRVMAEPAAANRKSGRFQQQLLLRSAFDGDLEGVREALDAGADIDGTSPLTEGLTALELAMVGGHREIFVLLVKRGANVNHVSPKGKTPLMICAEERLPMDFVTALVYPGGANYTVTNELGHSAEFLARLHRYDEMANYLSSSEVAADYARAQGEIASRKERR